ncbi:lasso peptide biosynthesis B2 protein [Hephaestia sp. GCM10023244]|uniref:lasso peptide biosynthesis B2 protein n=1 Tax=unclassified Hephaestia TaxID=2631281 RepID=UPI002076DC15|nr:lasso peptide biosynthesis B2 protein [Hephaestia sp. MAHUQ-44]MCM8732399.1 lasso peptide biosynthesis B2 protein [Hephaestia sp. MAHUQ-44]
MDGAPYRRAVSLDGENIMRISPGIYVAPIGERVVVLDIRTNRYSAFDGELAAALIWLSNSPRPDQPPPSLEALSRLTRCGFAQNDGPSESRDMPDVSTASAYPTPRYCDPLGQPLGLRGTIDVLGNLLSAWDALRSGSMAVLLRRLETSVCRSAAKYDTDLQRLIDAYYAARPFFPARPICRLDALALRGFLRGRGVSAQFVLGVRLDPFIAHSWVQVTEIAIGEAHDRIRQFTPMLVV